MRVITGSARGVRLDTLEGASTRPTVERVKEAMFSSIQFEVPGRRVLDLFAGSGQLGIEALSRGARHADFVDSSRQAVTVITGNLRRCELENKASVFCREWQSHLAGTTVPYDLVLLDPPYGKGLCEAAVQMLSDRGLLAKNVIVICETGDKESVPERFGALTVTRSTRYGTIRLTTYREGQP
ncbi:Ribosomal RNA small subunit methyltransferase D [bioreactor metagenome]|uniref:Ribosomal RNA small subunit methyltransferase D n=1 Tax=bioreactor metagenome TaxID=1076179 RepID=A0A644XKL4_9ZZZZ